MTLQPDSTAICQDEASPSSSHVGRKAWKYASRAARYMSNNSNIVDPAKENQIPTFLSKEIIVGKLLGSGGFNRVHELESIQLVNDPLNSDYDRKMYTEHQRILRNHVATHTQDPSGEAKYAIKFLSPETMLDSGRFVTGAADLAVECKFLANLEHPNIIKLRGMSAIGTFGFASGKSMGYFLILDRLRLTLEDLLVEWKQKAKRMLEFSLQRTFFHRRSKKNESFLADRINVALDVASALQYLHENKVIFRDLKPDNIGFDIQGTVKLFDFGLAKELDDSFKSGACPECYELTGNTGSMRYMSPEVALRVPYHLSADVYSFGLLLWQICSLEVPFHGLSRNDHWTYVIEGSERPVLDPTWSSTIHDLIQRCWDPVATCRPSMNVIYPWLHHEVTTLRRADAIMEMQATSSRRSIFDFNQESSSPRTMSKSGLVSKPKTIRGMLKNPRRSS